MVFLFNPAGNHSNILFQSLHFESYCLEHNYKFINFCINDFSHLYGIKKIKFAKVKILFLKVLQKIHFIKRYIYENTEEESFPPQFKNNCIVCGWCYRQYELVKKYKSYFQKKFQLLPEFYENTKIYKKFIQITNDGYLPVGIHIRKGDYLTAFDGKYYFEDDVYLKCINKIENLLQDKKPFFFIFSNEVNPISFNKDNIYFSNEKWYVDQFIMSQMKYLIGPPSTFSSWASYIGDVKLKFLENKECNFTMEDFDVNKG